ncbi:sensor histidine kinase [Microbacterium sp. NPDC055910]|uniref:sensor histidine kinase n=1 Tax=Microbacterium sp. NPDC055910 TaxID=3345659 RepID=UPI0035D6EB3C
MSWPPALRRRVGRAQFEDRTRARTTVLNQLLLGAVVLIVTLIAVIGDFPGDTPIFFAAVLVVFVGGGVAIAVPWNSLPQWVSIVLPLADVAAIAFMRESSPTAGFGLLWIFPAMWLASGFGLVGLFVSILSICTIYGFQTFLPDRPLTFSALLLPMAVIALSTTSYLTARRSRVQRILLDSQTRILGKALENARQQEQTVTSVLDAVDFGIIRVGEDGRIAVRNDAHGRLQRVKDTRAEQEATTLVPAYSRDGITLLPADEQPLARAMRGETFDDEVVWFGEPGEQRRALTVTARHLSDDDGQVTGTVIVSRDITTELIAVRAREDLVASVSHELRTPLTAIVGYLDLVLDEDLSPSARRGLEVAERNAHRLLSIVSDILAASSSDRTTVELSIRPQQTDIAAIAIAAIELQDPRAAERGIRIDSSGVESAVAFVDASRIRQVLDNLLSNAVKYNKDGGSIEVGTTTDDVHAWIVVRDSGRGISDAEMPRLFHRFFRSDAVRMTSTHGSGLGLAISRDIVRSHGGEITVRSELGSGTTFVVRLPLGAHRLEAPEGTV